MSPLGALIVKLSEVNQRENKRFQESCGEVGIHALARRPNHQAMWAYYADQGKGVCFEFDWSPEILQAHQLLVQPVEYSAQPRVINRAEDWRLTFLELAAQYPHATIDELQQRSLEESFRASWGLRMIAKATSIKHTDWQHEQEIRLLGPQARTHLPILNNVLRRVHFLRFDFAEVTRIAPLLYERYHQVDIVHWQFSHGDITAIGQPMVLKAMPIKPSNGG